MDYCTDGYRPIGIINWHMEKSFDSIVRRNPLGILCRVKQSVSLYDIYLSHMEKITGKRKDWECNACKKFLDTYGNAILVVGTYKERVKVYPALWRPTKVEAKEFTPMIEALHDAVMTNYHRDLEYYPYPFTWLDYKDIEKQEKNNSHLALNMIVSLGRTNAYNVLNHMTELFYNLRDVDNYWNISNRSLVKNYNKFREDVEDIHRLIILHQTGALKRAINQYTGNSQNASGVHTFLDGLNSVLPSEENDLRAKAIWIAFCNGLPVTWDGNGDVKSAIPYNNILRYARSNYVMWVWHRDKHPILDEYIKEVNPADRFYFKDVTAKLGNGWHRK